MIALSEHELPRVTAILIEGLPWLAVIEGSLALDAQHAVWNSIEVYETPGAPEWYQHQVESVYKAPIGAVKAVRMRST